MRHLIAGVALLLASTANAQTYSPAFDALVTEALAVSAAEKAAFERVFDAYGHDDVNVADAGIYELLAPTGDLIIIHAELIGTYDDATRTFTWGWATDAYPELERTAVDAVRAHGRANNVSELTSPKSFGGPVDATVRSSIATVLGELDVIITTEVAGQQLFLGLPNVDIKGTGS